MEGNPQFVDYISCGFSFFFKLMTCQSINLSTPSCSMYRNRTTASRRLICNTSRRGLPRQLRFKSQKSLIEFQGRRNMHDLLHVVKLIIFKAIPCVNFRKPLPYLGIKIWGLLLYFIDAIRNSFHIASIGPG